MISIFIILLFAFQFHIDIFIYFLLTIHFSRSHPIPIIGGNKPVTLTSTNKDLTARKGEGKTLFCQYLFNRIKKLLQYLFASFFPFFSQILFIAMLIINSLPHIFCYKLNSFIFILDAGLVSDTGKDAKLNLFLDIESDLNSLEARTYDLLQVLTNISLFHFLFLIWIFLICLLFQFFIFVWFLCFAYEHEIDTKS